jgi:DNA polymerase-3 subunit delta'
MELFPWHREAWQMLAAARRANRLAHALLLHAPEGWGGEQFARVLAQSLLCAQPDDDLAACGQCKSCSLWQAGTHPDFKLAAPEAEGKLIKVETVRELVTWTGNKSYAQRGKVAIVEPAEAMTGAAANSLLKTLEEPPPDQRFLLVSRQPNGLPITVRSRCQRLALAAPNHPSLKAWVGAHLPAGKDSDTALALAGGAPLLAVAEDQLFAQKLEVLQGLVELSAGRRDPLETAAKWKPAGPVAVLGWLMEFLAAAVQRAMTEALPSGLEGLAEPLSRLAAQSHPSRLLAAYDLCHYHYAMAHTQAKLRDQELLENICLFWSERSVA